MIGRATAPAIPHSLAPAVPLAPELVGKIRFLKSIGTSSDLRYVRDRLRREPAYFSQFTMEMQTTNPLVYQMIVEDPQRFLRLAMGHQHHRVDNPHPHAAPAPQFTTEEKAAIERVKIQFNSS